MGDPLYKNSSKSTVSLIFFSFLMTLYIALGVFSTKKLINQIKSPYSKSVSIMLIFIILISISNRYSVRIFLNLQKFINFNGETLQLLMIIPFTLSLYLPSLVIYIIIDIYLSINHWKENKKRFYSKVTKVTLFTLFVTNIGIVIYILSSDHNMQHNSNTIINVIEIFYWTLCTAVICGCFFVLNSAIKKLCEEQFGRQITKSIKYILVFFIFVAGVCIMISNLCSFYYSDIKSSLIK